MRTATSPPTGWPSCWPATTCSPCPTAAPPPPRTSCSATPTACRSWPPTSARSGSRCVDGVDGLLVPPERRGRAGGRAAPAGRAAAAAPPAGQRPDRRTCRARGRTTSARSRRWPRPGAGTAVPPEVRRRTTRRDGGAGGRGRPCRTGSWRRSRRAVRRARRPALDPDPRRPARLDPGQRRAHRRCRRRRGPRLGPLARPAAVRATAIAAWAALGALAAIVRVSDDGRHSAVIVDESGARSPLVRWARAIGFAPVELEPDGGAGLGRRPRRRHGLAGRHRPDAPQRVRRRRRRRGARARPPGRCARAA